MALRVTGGRYGEEPFGSNGMVKRYICISCGLSFRKDRKCDNCGDSLSAIDIDHTVYGILMYVLAGIALFMILMAFMGIGLLALLAFLPLAIAVGFNEITTKWTKSRPE